MIKNKYNKKGFIATAVLYSLILLISIILFIILKNVATTRKIEREGGVTVKQDLIYYEVEFNKGHEKATGTMKKIRISSGVTQKLPANKFMRTGYDFNGWKGTNAEGQTVSKRDQEEVINLTWAGQTITLNAQWKPKTFTVTFNPNGGTISTPTKTVTYDDTYGTLPTPVRTSEYEFDGWWTSCDGGTQIKSDTRVEILSNQTLCAHWKLKAFDVVYNCPTANGCKSAPATEKVVINGAINVNKNQKPAVSSKGYEFIGWTTNSSPNTTEANVITSLKMGTSAVNLYPVFKKIATVTFYRLKPIMKGGSVAKGTIDTIKESCTLYNNQQYCSITVPLLFNDATSNSSNKERVTWAPCDQLLNRTDAAYVYNHAQPAIGWKDANGNWIAKYPSNYQYEDNCISGHTCISNLGVYNKVSGDMNAYGQYFQIATMYWDYDQENGGLLNSIEFITASPDNINYRTISVTPSGTISTTNNGPYTLQLNSAVSGVESHGWEIVLSADSNNPAGRKFGNRDNFSYNCNIWLKARF